MTETTTPPRPFKLGFLTHVNGPGRPAGAVYRDLVETFVAAEELGFDGGFVAQHHLRGDYGRLPSPLVLFGAVAARTSRIELGTAVTVLPLEDPLRLAEDVAVLDALSGGRVQLGLGSGGANAEAFNAFGHDAAARHERFDAALEVLRGALRGEPILKDGDLTAGAAAPAEPLAPAAPLIAADGAPAGTDIRLQPPAPGLTGRLWQSTADNERARLIGASGDGFLLGTAVHDPETVQRPLGEAYLDGWRQEPPAADGPRVGVVRAVFPATDRRQARDDLAPAIAIHKQNFIKHGLTELSSLSLDEYLARINVHHGHPEEVVASLQADPALFGFATYFIPVVSHENSSLDDDLRRLEIVATQIAPALGWEPANLAATR